MQKATSAYQQSSALRGCKIPVKSLRSPQSLEGAGLSSLTIHPSSRALSFAACQAASEQGVVVGLGTAAENELRLIAGLVVHGTEPRHRDDDIAVLHHDGNVVRLPQGERPLCPQSDLFSLFADEWPRLSFAILHKGKPASFRLFPVSSYVVVPGAGSFLPTLFGLLNTIC